MAQALVEAAGEPVPDALDGLDQDDQDGDDGGHYIGHEELIGGADAEIAKPAGTDRADHGGTADQAAEGEPEPQVVGQLELGTFFNEAGLEAIGDNLLLETAASGPATVGVPGEVGYGNLLQHYTEASNVDAVSEITALIVAQRAYEMNSKVITTADDMLATTAQVKS